MATNVGQSFVVPWRLPSAPEHYDPENEQKFRRIIELALMKTASATETLAGDVGFELKRKAIRILVDVTGGDGEGVFELDAEAGADLLQISSGTPCRVLLYATDADLELDRARNELTLPTTPIILEVVLGEDVDNHTLRLFNQGVEGVHAFNRDDPALKNIYYRLILPAVNYVSGFAVNIFPGTAGLILDDDGRSASLYGFSYTPAVNPNPYGRSAPWLGGYDNYYVRGADGGSPNGLRARSNTRLGIARLFVVPPTTTQWQTTLVRRMPIDLDAAYGVSHSYFCEGVDKRNTLQVGFARVTASTAVASIGWYNNAGVYASLATGATFDVTTAKRLTTAVVGTQARLYVDAVLDVTATIPTELLSSGNRGLGLQMFSSFVPEAPRRYGGLTVLDYGVKSSDAPTVFLDLGYVPTEEPGGTIVVPE